MATNESVVSAEDDICWVALNVDRLRTIQAVEVCTVVK
jgi:hypothetical protein